MPKKTEYFSNAAILIRSGTNSFGTSPIMPYVNGSLSKQDQQIATETQKHMLIMHNKRLKAEVAVGEIDSLHQCGSSEFLTFAAHTTEVNEQAAGKPHEAVVKAFNELNRESCGNHILGAINVGAHAIAIEIERTIELPVEEEEEETPPPKPKPTILQRLLKG